MNETYQFYLIEDEDSLKELDRYLSEDNLCPLAFDTETTGLNQFCQDIGISVCLDPNVSFYIPTRIWNNISKKLEETPVRPLLRPYLEKWLLKEKRIIGHNIQFDARVILRNYNLNIVSNILSDTRLLFKMVISEDENSGLKDICIKYIDNKANQDQNDLKDSVIANGGKWLKKDKQMFMGSKDILAKYGAMDASLTLRLYEFLQPKLENDPLLKILWKEEILPLLSVVFTMNTTPFHVNLPFFESLRTEMQNDIENLGAEVIKDILPLIGDYEKELIIKNTKIARNQTAKKLALDSGFDMKALKPDEEFILKEAAYRHDFGFKSPFKLTSHDDLRWLIYTKLAEPVTKKTDTGKPSTDADVIEELSKKYTWAKILLEKRQLEKLLNTYVEGVFEHNINGVVYFDYDQAGTISGRFSTKGSIPIMTLPKTKTGIKKGFVAPKGYKLIAADFSSLEPHLAAYLSKDSDLIDSFISGKDFYSVIGIKQFNKTDSTPYKDETLNSFPVKYKEIRELCKTYALATLYGAEDHRISEVLHPEACDWQTRQKHKYEAQELIEGYFKAFPGIKKLIEESHKEAHLTGQIRTKFGRIRHMNLVKEVYEKHGFKLKDHQYAKQKGLMDLRREYKNYLNNSVNFKVQGLAAHACNRAAINIMNELKNQNLDAWICAQVHDEIICTAREDQVIKVKEIMEKCMSNSIDVSPIKLKAEAKIGDNLKEVK